MRVAIDIELVIHEGYLIRRCGCRARTPKTESNAAAGHDVWPNCNWNDPDSYWFPVPVDVCGESSAALEARLRAGVNKRIEAGRRRTLLIVLNCIIIAGTLFFGKPLLLCNGCLVRLLECVHVVFYQTVTSTCGSNALTTSLFLTLAVCKLWNKLRILYCPRSTTAAQSPHAVSSPTVGTNGPTKGRLG